MSIRGSSPVLISQADDCDRPVSTSLNSQRIVIAGPTASGKGRLAAELARRLDSEIVSVDSMKIYRGMDIGTAKPSPAERREIRYHLIDIVDPFEEFSVGEFIPRILAVVGEIESRGKTAILQGGTAFYLNALFRGIFDGPSADWELRRELEREADEKGLSHLYSELLHADPEVTRTIHAHDRRRIVRALEVLRSTGRKLSELWKNRSACFPENSYRCFGIEWEREALYRRIDERVEEMVRRGLFEEARGLLKDPRGLGRSAAFCLGYRQIIEGEATGRDPAETVAVIQRDTRRFAKQQLTWFRKFPMEWLPPEPPERLADRVLAVR